jgi:hypothetical protein
LEKSIKWIDDVNKSNLQDPLIVLIGNKLDMNSSRRVEKSKVEEFIKNTDYLFYEVSAKT